MENLALGRPGDAVRHLEETLDLVEDRSVVVLGSLGLAYSLAGRREDAARIRDEIERTAQERYVSPAHRAVVHSGLGEMDEAFHHLDRALEERAPMLLHLAHKHAPESMLLRRDSRWEPLLDRVRAQLHLPPGTPDPFR